MDKQLVEEMAKDVACAGQIAGDWLMEEAKKLLQENGRFKSTEHTRTLADIVAEELAKMGYRKIHEGAVVLTREEHIQMLKDLANSNEIAYLSGYGKGSTETAEKFAERLKEEYSKIAKECEESYDEVLGCDLPERCLPNVIDQYGYIDCIDQICKEITEGKDNAISRSI